LRAAARLRRGAPAVHVLRGFALAAPPASHAPRLRAAAPAPALAVHGRVPAHRARGFVSATPSSSRSACDVVILGGRPAGSSAAWHLARAGARVTILDRARFPREKPCAEYLSPEASRLLHAMDVLDACERAGAAHLAGMAIHAPGGACAEGTFA